jgi:NlpC/P60 family
VRLGVAARRHDARAPAVPRRARAGRGADASRGPGRTRLAARFHEPKRPGRNRAPIPGREVPERRTDPRTGFDCSGFTQYVFAQYGVALPREVVDQYRVGAPVGGRNLEPGDLIFFSTVTRGASHVAIALGGDQFVHAPSSRGVVRVERLSSSYWGPRFLGARRVSAN